MHTPAAFISYAHRDDEAYGGRISELRRQLALVVGAAVGQDFEIFQDRDGIAWGQHWPSRLDEALEQALFLIPILTPSYFNSPPCRGELEKFLELERRAGRNDLVLPIYFRTARVLKDGSDLLAMRLAERQYRDWRELRHHPIHSPDVMREIDLLADEIDAAIHRSIAAASPPPVVLGLDPRTRVAGGSGPTQEPEGRGAKLGPWVKPEDDKIEPGPRVEPVEPEDDKGRAAPRVVIGDPGPKPVPGTIFKDIAAPWCPEMVVIPAGSFLMGSPEDEEGRGRSEGPQHEVRFARPFALGRFPVTFDEYDHFCEATGTDKPGDSGWGRGRRPVIEVSWEDARSYCQWLSEVTKQPYRLPSEAEWEYACRAGTTTPFWTGATVSTDQANYRNYIDGSGIKGEYRGKTTPVDTFAANPWGLHDMHGNVQEWCEDRWHGDSRGAPADGSPWLEGNSSQKVVRGGSWASRADSLRSAFRYGIGPRDWYDILGFRVARTLLTP